MWEAYLYSVRASIQHVTFSICSRRCVGVLNVNNTIQIGIQKFSENMWGLKAQIEPYPLQLSHK